MTFAGRIATDVGVLYYVRFSGIPYIFHNGNAMPSSWLTAGKVQIDSEDYTPSPTLVVDSGMLYKNTIQPKAGIGKSSGMTLSFMLDDTWLDLVNIHLYRSGGDRYSIISDNDIEPTDTTFGLDSSTGASPADELYAGLETISVATVPNSTSITVNRGLYGSQQQRFAGLTDGLLETGALGAWMVDHPGVWTGRYVEVWLATGTWEGTTFTPYGATAESTEDKRIFVGKVSDWSLSKDLHRVSFSLQPLDRVLQEDVGYRLPTIDVGHRTAGAVPVDGESDKICMSFWVEDAAYSYEIALDSAAGFGDPHGLNPIGSLLADIAYTLNNAFENETLAVPWWTIGTTFISITHTVVSGKIVLDFAINSPATVSYVMYSVQLHARHGSVWRQLGFTGTHTFSAQGKTLETTTIQFSAQRGLPALFISRAGRSDTTDLRIWYRSTRGPAIDFDAGWDEDDGTNVGAYFKIGEEIFKASSSTSFTRYGDTWNYLTTSGRAQLGSFAQEHYIELGEEVPDAVQVIGLAGMQLPKAWLYLLLGGSGTKTHNHATWDQGWYGSGVYLDGNYIDVTSFTDLAATSGVIADNLCISEPEPLRDVVQGDAIITGMCIIAGPDGVRLIDVSPPGEADAADAVLALDSTNTRTTGAGGRGIVVELGERRVVNDVMIETDYDNGIQKHRHKIWHIAADSVGTYGRKPRLSAKLRAVRGSQLASEAAERILAAYKAPYAVVTVDVADPLWWTVELGDIVTLSHALIPTLSNGISFVTVGRGITALPARVMSITHQYPKSATHSKSSRGSAVLMVGNISEVGTGPISPSAYCSSIVTDTCTITDRYGGDEEAEFVAGDLVNLRSYDGSTVVAATIDEVNANEIILSSAPAISAPFLIEPREYSAALQDAQRTTAFGAAGDTRVLDKPSAGTDPLKRYR